MENKYYTPDIEEFRVGFEFEWRISKISEDWDEGIVDKNTSYNSYVTDKGFTEVMGIYELLTGSDSEIRVKYLDREDIESLGFKYDNNAEPIPSRQEWEKLPLEQYELPLAFMKDTQLKDGRLWILYLYSDNTVWIEYIKDCAGYGYYFKGIIKNKSELKLLLKQLGIAYEERSRVI